MDDVSRMSAPVLLVTVIYMLGPDTDMAPAVSKEQSGVGVMVGVSVGVAVGSGVLVGSGVKVLVGVLVGSGVGLGKTSVGSNPTIRETRNCSTTISRLAVRWSHGQIVLKNGTNTGWLKSTMTIIRLPGVPAEG